MPEKQKQPNLRLRLERKNRGWSQARLAELIGADNSMVSRWECGERNPEPFYQEKLCTLFNKSATELGFLDEYTPSFMPIQPLLPSKQYLHEQILNPVVLSESAQSAISKYQSELRSSNSSFLDIATSSIESLTTITQLYRTMQRCGDTFIINGINAQIYMLEDILNNTHNDKLRQDLWKILAQTQLLAAFHPRRKSEATRTKMFYECAIASAQNSEDKQLVGAAIGHLAHFSLRQEQDIQKASHLVEQAQEYFPKSHAFNGWLSLLMASISSKKQHRMDCESYLENAIHIAHELPLTTEYTDIYYTDFSYISALVFTINCWLSMEDGIKAHETLTKTNLADLSDNRRASAFYDAAKIFFMQGTPEIAQEYAFLAIDKALATQQTYIIPRCTGLAQAILQKEPHEVHAIFIINYARDVLQQEESYR